MMKLLAEIRKELSLICFDDLCKGKKTILTGIYHFLVKVTH